MNLNLNATVVVDDDVDRSSFTSCTTGGLRSTPVRVVNGNVNVDGGVQVQVHVKVNAP